MTPLCWEGWVERFQSNGYTCLAPAWPGRDKPVEALRAAHPDPQLGQLTLSAVIEHLAGVIQKLPEKPVLIGHSMGGLVTQLLLQRGLAAAGVAIDSAPPAGVFTAQWSFLKANFPMINPLIASGTPRLMSFEDFQYAFVNAMPPDEQRRAYDRYTVPESRRVPRQSLTGVARIDFSRPHPPLLLTAGTDDHIIPAALNRANYARYRAFSPSGTDFKEFSGRCHFLIGQPGWEEVADYVLAWLQEQGL
jgi:pimeloyl-ACP methyl ester carboxylesterase